MCVEDVKLGLANGKLYLPPPWISHTWLDARNKRLKAALGRCSNFVLHYCRLSNVQTPSAHGACLQHFFPMISQRYNRDTIQEISRRHFCSPKCLNLPKSYSKSFLLSIIKFSNLCQLWELHEPEGTGTRDTRL